MKFLYNEMKNRETNIWEKKYKIKKRLEEET